VGQAAQEAETLETDEARDVGENDMEATDEDDPKGAENDVFDAEDESEGAEKDVFEVEELDVTRPPLTPELEETPPLGWIENEALIDATSDDEAACDPAGMDEAMLDEELIAGEPPEW
jgi:hypothetical protein